jgi:hypothetical protein
MVIIYKYVLKGNNEATGDGVSFVAPLETSFRQKIHQDSHLRSQCALPLPSLLLLLLILWRRQLDLLRLLALLGTSIAAAADPNLVEFSVDVLAALGPGVDLGELRLELGDLLGDAVLFAGGTDADEFVLVGFGAEAEGEGVVVVALERGTG